jgi:hypothetical protein
MAFGFLSDDMEHLMTIAALFVSTAAVAQIPTLPWNPDGNDDQFIGLPDLLDLLTVYGQEFENAIVAEDGESAIMYIGDVGYPQCQYACENLPGFWTMPKLQDLVPVWSDVNANGVASTWLQTEWTSLLNTSLSGNNMRWPYYYGNTAQGQYHGQVKMTLRSDDVFQCYCTAKQLPRVEYSVCAISNNNFISAGSIEACCQQKVSEGWLPLGGTAESDNTVSQAFWRFAQ